MTPKDFLGHTARGFAMGAADIVPGVSGGTIALILGVYERLLASIRTGARSLSRLARGDISGFIEQFKSIEWPFIIPLMTGIVAAFLVLSSVLDRLLINEPEAMAGLFFGLVVASIFVAWQLLSNRDPGRMAVLVAVAVVAFFVLGLKSGSVSDPSAIAFFFTGAIAICAMILPGISGSFLMLMLGMYAAFVGAVHDREITNLLFFVLGALAGLAAFSTLLWWILEHHRDTLLAALIGLPCWPHSLVSWLVPCGCCGRGQTVLEPSKTTRPNRSAAPPLIYPTTSAKPGCPSCLPSLPMQS